MVNPLWERFEHSEFGVASGRGNETTYVETDLENVYGFVDATGCLGNHARPNIVVSMRQATQDEVPVAGMQCLVPVDTWHKKRTISCSIGM